MASRNPYITYLLLAEMDTGPSWEKAHCNLHDLATQMKARYLRRVAYALLALVLAAGLLWLALPRLIGFAAGRWLRVPGLETLALDLDTVGPKRLHARNVRGVYRTP